jgi:hypothetical protein
MKSQNQNRGLVEKIKKLSKPTLITTKDTALRNQINVTEDLDQQGILGIDWLRHSITKRDHTMFKKTPDTHKRIMESIPESVDFFKGTIILPGCLNMIVRSSWIKKGKYKFDLPECVPKKKSELILTA